MIKEFIEKWDKYKNELEKYFAMTDQSEYQEYQDIVKVLFEKVINRDITYGKYDIKNMIVIDDGDYQGTQIFILHKDLYKPNVEDYIYTNTYYGSCSGCDTLQAIQEWNGIPSKNQVKEYMTLALHLLQKCEFMKGEEYYE